MVVCEGPWEIVKVFWESELGVMAVDVVPWTHCPPGSPSWLWCATVTECWRS